MFPKGARFLSLGRPRFCKSQVARDFLPLEAKNMANFVDQANRAFVVVMSDDSGKHRGAYIVSQYVAPRDGERGQQRIRNQVERHLYHQFRRTGLHHSVVYEGNPEMAEAILQAETDCPF